MTTSPEVRNGIIDQAQQQRMVRDTVILQKVNAAHREAFKTRFPGQVEHCLRLTAERLQACLINKPDNLADPATWAATAQEIAHLCEAIYYLNQVRRDTPVEE
jgi:hypothetical protein